MGWGVNSESIEHSQELGLCHVAVLGDIEVLKHGLQMHSQSLDSLAVFLKYLVDLAVT